MEKWLPITGARRTLGRKERPVFWLGVNDLFSSHRAKKERKKGRTPREVTRREDGKERRRAEWTALLEAGTVRSRADLARYLGVSRAYVTQVLGPVVHAVHAEREDFPDGGEGVAGGGGR